jgi:hypothetical protein
MKPDSTKIDELSGVWIYSYLLFSKKYFFTYALPKKRTKYEKKNLLGQNFIKYFVGQWSFKKKCF